MWDFLTRLLQSDFMPHGYCYLWVRSVLWLNAISDVLIALAYFSIPATLFYFVRRRRDLPFNWMFMLFGLFIFGCGATHAMEVWTLWIPQYRLAGLIKLLTAVASVATASLMIPTVPKALALPRPEDLRRALREKELEVAGRRKVEASLRTLSARLLRSQDCERRRIARELHDSVGQHLAALRMNLETVNRAAEISGVMSCEAITESVRLTDDCIREIRTISYLLHPPELDMMGLAAAVRSYVDGFTKRSGIQVALNFPAGLGRLEADVELALFRVIQECLTNIHRHSQSPRAGIALCSRPGEILLEVSDEGKGVPSDLSDSGRQGVGIVGMRERMKEFGGSLEVKSCANGTRVLATMPLACAGR